MKKLLVVLLSLFASSTRTEGILRFKQLVFTGLSQFNKDISISIEGGTPPYVYTTLKNGIPDSITTMSKTASFQDVDISTVSNGVITVDDAASQQIIASAVDDGNTVLEESTFNFTHPCDGMSDGIITIAGDGTQGETFFLNGVENSSGVFVSLAPGEYTAETAAPDLNAPPPNNLAPGVRVTTNLFSLDPVSISAHAFPTTCGNDNGSIMLRSITGGGGGPYQVEISPSVQSPIEFPMNDTFSNLAAGSYTLTATSVNGCTGTSMLLSVDSSTGVTITTIETIKEPSCYDSSDGSIKVTASSMNPPITFKLNGETMVDDSMVTFDGLAGGMYTVMVTDAKGCMATGNHQLTAPSQTSFFISSFATTCGESNGSVEISPVSGGTPPYEGCLIDVTTGNGRCVEVPGKFEDVSPGTYQVSVKDANNCIQYSNSFEISSSVGVMITDVTKTDPTCAGSTNGSITVTATSESTNIVYTLFVGDEQIDSNMTGIFTGLGLGNYTIYVTDADTGCIGMAMTMLSQPAPLIFFANFAGTTCDEPNGRVEVTEVFGGIPPYEGCLVNVENNEKTCMAVPGVFEGVAAGLYKVIITDNNGCELPSGEFAITASRSVAITKVQVESPTCPNINDGAIEIFTQSPNSQSVRYVLLGPVIRDEDSSTGSILFENLPGGFYIIEVEDELGCVDRTRREVPMISPIRFRQPKATPVTCCNADNGTILLKEDQVVGGTPPYTYSIGTNVGYIPVGDPFMNLKAGTYAVTVLDANGCQSMSRRVIVSPAEDIVICKVCTTPATKGKCNGTLRVVAQSKAPLQYALDGGQFQDSPLFTNLKSGTYRVVVNRRGDTSSECATCCAQVKRVKRKGC